MQCDILLFQALVLSKHATRDATAGHVVNLLSTDVTRFDWNMFSQYIVVGPLQLAIFGFLLWRELQVVAFAGVGMVAILLPMQCMTMNMCMCVMDFYK